MTEFQVAFFGGITVGILIQLLFVNNTLYKIVDVLKRIADKEEK